MRDLYDLNFARGFPAFSSQEIGSSLVSFQMILEAAQFELVRFDFHSLGSKLKNNPGIQPMDKLNWSLMSAESI